MVTHHRPFHMSSVAGGGGGRIAGGNQSAADTTFTKIFVGGLAWETQKETMCRYFDQFGEILEAVVITDKHTGRSKGYGFVTFTDPEAAARACLDLSPVIDGRRANCNLASLGATHKPRPSASQFGQSLQSPSASFCTNFFFPSFYFLLNVFIVGLVFTGNGQFLTPAAGHALTSSAYRGSHTSPVSTAYFHQPAPYALPYSLYGGGYSQESVYPMCYYGLTGGQQQQQHHHFSPFYPTTSPGVFPNFYPYYTPYSHSCQSQEGFGLHYPQMLQYPYPPTLGSSSGILSLPTTISANAAVIAASSSSKLPGTIQEQRPII